VSVVYPIWRERFLIMAASVQAPGRVDDPTRDIQSEEERRRRIELNQEVIDLLQSWLEDDEETEEEQREALESLKRGIDEHRTPGNKIFS
jgi:hypothetical protein